jgi:hypothetical protein
VNCNFPKWSQLVLCPLLCRVMNFNVVLAFRANSPCEPLANGYVIRCRARSASDKMRLITRPTLPARRSKSCGLYVRLQLLRLSDYSYCDRVQKILQQRHALWCLHESSVLEAGDALQEMWMLTEAYKSTCVGA